MKKIYIEPPNCKQQRFFTSKARYVGYGGARGGGKSWALRVKLVLMAFYYPGIRLLLLRRTLAELRENHLIPLMKLLSGVAKYNQSERTFLFPNGSRLKLGYCDHEKDIYQYQGQEYDVIGVEECTHFTWEQIVFLTTCNRTVRTDLKPRMFFTGNPGGVGHSWFRRLFVKGVYEASERAEDYEFIPATVDDNEVLMRTNPEYVRVLDNLPEKLRQAHRYGNWDIFDGQFFEEFRDDVAHYHDRRFTHVIEPFEIPPGWKIYRSFDFGYAKPFSCGWWAQDYDGRLYRILELYGCTKQPNTGLKWVPEKIFKQIRQIEREHRWLKNKPIQGVADPAIWDASKGESIAEEAMRCGVFFEKGDHKRIPGWMQVHYRMSFDEKGIPMLYVFQNCRGFIRTMPMLTYDRVNPEDLDTNGEDHIADEVRYLCMEHPIAPKPVQVKKALAYNPLDEDRDSYGRYEYWAL